MAVSGDSLRLAVGCLDNLDFDAVPSIFDIQLHPMNPSNSGPTVGSLLFVKAVRHTINPDSLLPLGCRAFIMYDTLCGIAL